MKCEKVLPTTLNYGSRLIKEPLNKYYLCIPNLRIKDKNNGNENQVSRKIALDSGVRTFQTGYDPEGYIIKFGSKDIEVLYRLERNKHKLQGQISKLTGSKRYRYKKAYTRLSKRIENLVTECHRKIILWLCTNYNVILATKLNFHDFKKISKKNKIRMALWNHCLFVQRLQDKSKEFKNCVVKVVTEEYTSKTCGNCGTLNHSLGSSETFKCDKCGAELDRDSNGARCIYLKEETPK